MKTLARLLLASLILCLALAPLSFAGDAIPKAAWKRGIGVPLENPGGRKPALAASGILTMAIGKAFLLAAWAQDFFPQLSRRFRALAHQGRRPQISARVCRISLQCFSNRQATTGTAQVLMNGHPPGWRVLQSGSWDYPVGAGDYYRAISESVVRLPIQQVSRSRHARAILSGSSQ